MGKLPKGIFGPWSGKTGNLVGANVNGTNVVRTKPRKTNKEPTFAQVAQRTKMKLISHFLTSLKSFTEIGFVPENKTHSSANVAVKANMNHVIMDNSGNLEVDYPKIMISKGNLFRSSGLKLSYDGEAKLHITWNDDSEHWGDSEKENRGGDQLMIATMHTVKGVICVAGSVDLATRADLSATLNLGRLKDVGSVMHCWIFFASADGKQVSPSEYYACPL